MLAGFLIIKLSLDNDSQVQKNNPQRETNQDLGELADSPFSLPFRTCVDPLCRAVRVSPKLLGPRPGEMSASEYRGGGVREQ